MAVATLSALLVQVCLALNILSLASVASAQDTGDATTTPQDLLEYITEWRMALVIKTTEEAPFGSPYDVVPLTTEAGQQDASNLPDINGDLILLDHSNFTQVNYSSKVVFLSCDPSTTGSDPNWITPDRMLNSIMNNSAKPNAILLYSTTKSYCFLGGRNLTYRLVWTMASQEDAIKVRGVLTETNTDHIVASITPSSKAVQSQQPRPGSTSAIAMSILYSITGLITLLFLLIIGTGAVRAHRNPERYGPRASVNGRPRRSRARGLAMAMLETLPIVKFGETDPRKPDEENALESVPRVESQSQDGSRAATGATSSNDAVLEPSPEAVDATPSQHKPESAAVATSSTPDKAKEPEPENDHLGCSICTEDFTVGEDVRVLPCDHKFHPACVDPWLVNVSGTCPLCRLDLRPPEDIEREGNEETAASSNTTVVVPADGNLAPPTAADQATTGETTHRRRRSRLLDWNRLRHASVDERLQALRLYRQSQQGAGLASDTADDERRHSRLTDRLRERFHIRGDSRSGATSPEHPLPPASTTQH
ncbi:putative RING-7 protein [Rosellinia necatrix]|uniref:Putative RING-7 protein n=1 Tax=Rosellinia necatrix TaxID=77044 RepID=A0A1S7UKQ3_ROSNE|nr:putative RING-7 protein [Rosellinia necatrix]